MANHRFIVLAHTAAFFSRVRNDLICLMIHFGDLPPSSRSMMRERASLGTRRQNLIRNYTVHCQHIWPLELCSLSTAAYDSLNFTWGPPAKRTKPTTLRNTTSCRPAMATAGQHPVCNQQSSTRRITRFVQSHDVLLRTGWTRTCRRWDFIGLTAIKGRTQLYDGMRTKVPCPA